MTRDRYIQVRSRPRWFSRCAPFYVLLLSLVLSGIGLTEDFNRKVIARTAPNYPELAKRMHLTGKVKLQVVITAAGSVKSAKLVGGNPVFEQSALDTVKQWRFSPVDKDTTEFIMLEFAEK
jgi:TonB family protein